MDEKTLQLNTMRLCSTWLKYLDHAGKYTSRYYLSRDLELPPSEQNPGTRPALTRHYKTEKNLLGVIQRDLDTFPSELRAINAAQVACGLPPFSERDDYLATITMGFAIHERHGKERRAYYRRTIQKMLKTLNGGGQVIALSLNQLEAKFQESQQRAEARRAKKATKTAAAVEATKAAFLAEE